ncbi:MAG: RNA chaperone Hfq [Clostridia bacterium]|nr:RNA chaperone Hfq [Clostridia bacterium]
MRNGINLQDTLLNQARKENILVTVFLLNGFQIRGVIRGFDNYCILIDSEGKQQLIYKHAISTLIPAKTISIMDAKE